VTPGAGGPTASFSPNLEFGDFAVCGIPSWRRQSSSEDNSISFRAGSARLPTIVTTPFCDSGDGFSNFLSSQKLGHDFVINDLFWPSCKPLCINKWTSAAVHDSILQGHFRSDFPHPQRSPKHRPADSWFYSGQVLAKSKPAAVSAPSLAERAQTPGWVKNRGEPVPAANRAGLLRSCQRGLRGSLNAPARVDCQRANNLLTRTTI
jgi:hypothetical protein